VWACGCVGAWVRGCVGVRMHQLNPTYLTDG